MRHFVTVVTATCLNYVADNMQHGNMDAGKGTNPGICLAPWFGRENIFTLEEHKALQQLIIATVFFIVKTL
jgi:hypothetical protein